MEWRMMTERISAGEKLFTAEFLDRLREEAGALTMINHYMKDQGISFHDAILKFANFHSIEPEYVYSGYVGPKIDKEKLQKLIDEFV